MAQGEEMGLVSMISNLILGKDETFKRVTEVKEPEHPNNATRQIMKELKEFNAHSFSLDQISVSMKGDDPFSLLIILTPNDGLYKDAYYEVGMTMTKEYPQVRPKMKWESEIFHPNLAYSGEICFSLLNESSTNLRITDYAHGLLWLLYHPNQFSLMNSDCPKDEKKFVSMVRTSINGGTVCGRVYKRSRMLPEEKVKEKGEAKEEQEEGDGFVRSEKDGKQWVWRLVGDEWVQFFEDEFEVIEEKQKRAREEREEEERSYRNMCFAGQCQVLMADGQHRRVDEIQRGDLVSAGSEAPSAEIECVVRTRIEGGSTRLVQLEGGLLVTERHPVRINGGRVWQFPVDLAPSSIHHDIPYIYSFVMRTGHVMVINGVEGIGLGHNFRGDEVAEHPYLGTDRIVESLSELRGWGTGMVTLREGAFVRSPVTHMLDSLDVHHEILV